MRKLMAFSKDELVLLDQDDEDSSGSEGEQDVNFKKGKVLSGVQDA